MKTRAVRPRIGALLWAAAVLAPGCATYSTYTCPEPIGEIVRQDCDDYRVRYESLQASLHVSFGSISIGGSLGREHLRDPSELVQVMMQQTLALCHDYNACRVPNAQFSRRREQMDRSFTAVMALAEQLRAPGLSETERHSLLRELVAILKPPAEPGPAKPGQPAEAKPEPKSIFSRDPFRRVTSFFTATRARPPQPERPADRPVVLWVNGQQDSRGPLKGFTVELWGKVAEDDDLWALGPGGFRVRCRLVRDRDEPLARAGCRPKREADMPQVDVFELRYTIGVRDETVSLGKIDLRPGAQADEVWLAFQPEPIDQVPILRERPYLMMTTAARTDAPVTARCFHDGKPFKVGGTAVLKGDRDFNPYVRLRRHAIGLPFVLDYGDVRMPSSEDPPIASAAGRWRCKLKLGVHSVREVRFEIGPAGRLEPDPRQAGKPGDVSSLWWLVETKVLPNPLEPATRPGA